MNTFRGIAGRSLSYNDEDQLLSVGGTTYQYDADGFLSAKNDGASKTTYSYSSRGELLSVALPDGRSMEYVYDPLGRRIAKKINGSIVEKYLWAGLTQLLAVYDASNNVVMRFEYSDGMTPNVMTKGSSTYYLTYDQVGSLRGVFDATGSLVKRIEYDSFGNIINDTNPSFNVPLGFAGGLHDRDIALVHFGYRDYDPATGRWTAKDPIGFSGGDTNLYNYVLSDPVNLVDPWGLFTIQVGIQDAGGLIVGKSITKGFVVGFSFKNGFQASTFVSTGMGIYSGAGVSAGLNLSFSPTDNICNLSGSSFAAGGSLGELLSLGIEKSENSDGTGVYGLNLGVGVGLFAESHLFNTETIIGKKR